MSISLGKVHNLLKDVNQHLTQNIHQEIIGNISIEYKASVRLDRTKLPPLLQYR